VGRKLAHNHQNYPRFMARRGQVRGSKQSIGHRAIGECTQSFTEKYQKNSLRFARSQPVYPREAPLLQGCSTLASYALLCQGEAEV
jgi:hypothetical protein